MTGRGPRSRFLTASAGAILFVLGLLCPTPARGFCRSLACPLPAGFAPQPDACVPADFASFCASQNPPARPLPLFWRSACVGYDLQQDASRQVPYPVASTLFAHAFGKWTSLECTGATGPGGSARVSIDARDLGPVACNEVQYNQTSGNQHVIVFRDQVWPHDDQLNTLGLTTVTYDPGTGEIFDADMEINATVPLALTDPVPAGSYDLQSIITHESGHFLGMAHSGDANATMYAFYAMGATSMRTLSADDVTGLCSIYLPDGTRAVDPSVVASGRLPEDPCDPTPRHGFSSECALPKSATCGVAGGAGAGCVDGATRSAFGAIGLALAAVLRRRRGCAS